MKGRNRTDFAAGKQKQWWASPGFPVELGGVKELYAAFLRESRKREHGRRRVQEIRVAHLSNPTYAEANVGTPPLPASASGGAPQAQDTFFSTSQRTCDRSSPLKRKCGHYGTVTTIFPTCVFDSRYLYASTVWANGKVFAIFG
jgi:hypothetical protein